MARQIFELRHVYFDQVFWLNRVEACFGARKGQRVLKFFEVDGVLFVKLITTLKILLLVYSFSSALRR